MYLLRVGRALTRKNLVLSAFVTSLITSLAIATAWGFSIPIHIDITKGTIAMITAQVGGQPKKFSKRALEQIAAGNVGVDLFAPAFFFDAGHFTNEKFKDSSTRLKNLKAEIVMKVTADKPDGAGARSLLGQALHTIQDFYAHSNWVEIGKNGINMDLGRNIMKDPAADFKPCPMDPNMLGPKGGGGLTSGYYVGPGGCDPLPIPGKCYHGNYKDACKGINKDDPNQGGPGQHAAARKLAEAATKDYVEMILTTLAGNDKALTALLDLNGALGFIIDDTGSMGPSIDGVKTAVAKIVEEVRENPDSQPDSYVLVRFGDPDVGSALVTDDADELLAAVNALSPHGGGDCPELSQAALLEAIDKASFNSKLYLFTDASAKDSSLANEVISRAQEKSAELNYALTGSCSPIDKAYIRGAAETGGQLFSLSPSELPQLFDLIKPQLSGDLVTILSTKGVLATGAPRLFDVPVDSTIRRLVISVSMNPGTAITLRRPSGVPVASTDPDAQITSIASGRFLTINAPTPGIWQVEISGGGNFSMVAEGNSPFEFYRFDFVKPSGDIHGGFFPIPGQPLAGAEGTGEATLLGSFSTSTFKLVSEGGETIEDINLAQNFPNAVPDHFVGMFLPPEVPFRVVATGNDSAGFQYQRTYPTVYRAQVVGVEVDAGGGGEIQAGTARTFSFTVKNLGAPATFRTNVVSSLGSITGVNPTTLSLETGASGTVQFNVSVPAGTPDETSFAITMTAAKTDDSTVFNSVILNLVVNATLSDTDVSISMSELADPVMIRDNITYHIEVTNHGSADATGVVVTHSLPFNSTFVSAKPSVGSCETVAGKVICYIGNLAVGATQTINVVVKSRGNPNTILSLATVKADQPDPVTINNRVSELTRLVGFRRFFFAPSIVHGGCQNSQGTLLFTSPAPAGLTINFADSSPDVAQIPSVTTVGGETSIRVTAETDNVNSVQVAHITATTSQGTNSIQARLKLLPVEIASLTFNQNPVRAGTTVTATVTLTCPAPSQIVVKVWSNRAAAKPEVSQVVFNPGDTSQQFTIRTRNPGVPVMAMITAQSPSRGVQRSFLLIIQ
jgi:uncharacterized repeat protein (TIGR01451 family)